MRQGGERTAAPALAALLIGCTVAGVGPAAAAVRSQEEAEGPTIRVLLRDARGPVRVDPAGAVGTLRVQAGRGGLVASGRARGARIRFEGPGPHRVDGRRYRGAIEVLRRGETIRVVNEVPLEAYVAGTLLGEVMESWGGTVLEAQAVASRSYGLYRRRHAGSRGWDVEADTRGQVYLGADGESEAAWRAVEATRGQVLAWDGEVILAAFHATAGGRTASAAEVWGRPLPYLQSVAVEGEEASPDTYWRAPISRAELEALLERLGRPIGQVEAVEDAGRTASGRSGGVRVRGSRGETTLTASELRRALGGERRLRSALFAVRRSAEGFVFVGSGRGHGVGMSQWGARVLAERGLGYRAILEHFYPGAALGALEASAAGIAAAGGAGRSW